MSTVKYMSQAEHIRNLVVGLSSMNIVQENLQEQLRKVRLEKEVEKKEYKKLIQKARQDPEYNSSHENDARYDPQSRHKIPTRKRKANGNREATANSTKLPGHANADSDSDSEILYSATYHTITIFTYIWFQYNGPRRPPLRKICCWHGGHPDEIFIVMYMHMYM